MEDAVFLICGSCRAAPIVCEHVPGSVAKRYRSIKYVSVAALVEAFSDQWFIDFVQDKNGVPTEIVLTVSGGSQVPPQPEVMTHGTTSSRGTLIVSPARTKTLTGPFCVKFLQSSPNAHDIFVTSSGFEYHRLIPELVNLKTRRPKLFFRQTLSKNMKKTATIKK